MGNLLPESEEEKQRKRQLARRFQEQCYLMSNWESITQQGMEGLTGGYDNFFPLSGHKPYEYNNVLFRKTSESERLLSLTTPQISILVPQVDIYKEIIDPRTRERITIRLPFDDVVQKKNILNMTATAAGRGGGAGLKGFSWKSIGKNPGDRYSFRAELKIHFQNISDIYEVRNTTVTNAGDVIDVRFVDLIYSQAKFRRNGGEDGNEGPFTYNKDYFRIKVVCGWNVKNNMNVPLIDRKTIDAINETKTVFYLSLHSHDIDFRDDGTVDLKINYIAYAEALSSDPVDSNILYEDEQTKAERKKIEKKIEEMEKQNESIEQNAALSDEQKEKQKKNEDEFKAARTELSEANALTRDRAYRRIMTGLFESGKIFQVLVEKDYFDKRVDYLLKGTTGGSGTGKTETIGLTKQQVESTIANNTKPAVNIVSTGNPAPELEGTPVKGADVTAQESVGLASNQIYELSAEPILENDKYQVVRFFYFGDLMDVVLRGMFVPEESIASPNVPFAEKELRVILGNIAFVDHGTLSDSGFVMQDISGIEKQGANGGTYTKLFDGKESSVNMAYIPISVRVFAAWFRNTIMSKKKTRFTFKEFLDSIVNDLLIRALATECYEYAPRQKARLKYKTFVAPRNKKREALFNRVNERPGPVSVEHFRKEGCEFRLPVSKLDLSVSRDEGDLDTYLMIYGEQENPWELTGEATRDRERGIYHLNFGNEKGLVKKMKFKREDMPYMRASNIYNNSQGKNNPSKILRELYNVNIDMVGNNLFEIGGQVRIVPTIPNENKLSVRTKQILDLGIGGYFNIVGVQSNIEDGKYVTNLDARWTARGDGTTNIGDKRFKIKRAYEVTSQEMSKEFAATQIKRGQTGSVEFNEDAKRAYAGKLRTTKEKEKINNFIDKTSKIVPGLIGGTLGLATGPIGAGLVGSSFYLNEESTGVFKKALEFANEKLPEAFNAVLRETEDEE